MASSVNLAFNENVENEQYSVNSYPTKSKDTFVDISSDGGLLSIKDQMTSFVFEQGKEKARKAFNVYANIDILRPYFHIEPKDLASRLLHSLIPSKTEKVYVELYGPLMLVFTLIALLLFGMKNAGHVREGTLMGSAFAVCFGYWFLSSSSVYLISYLCSTRINFLQILTLVGYSLFSSCLILLLSTVFHFHSFFYLLFLVFGGLSAAKMVLFLGCRTSFSTHRIFISITVCAFHLMFILYLHFAYHKTVEAIDSI